ncbi:hypothetical protein DSO57_1025645 [Entomophthora muscae]|uniref:Uncharacterized protein n=1 Tax=Entomophthora muscae TaxID=34485 RepID=A0ACC2S4A5_9FUNG|nr:hypothetical protein DSO57_1025645 [Entomophthora muscae]
MARHGIRLVCKQGHGASLEHPFTEEAQVCQAPIWEITCSVNPNRAGSSGQQAGLHRESFGAKKAGVTDIWFDQEPWQENEELILSEQGQVSLAQHSYGPDKFGILLCRCCSLPQREGFLTIRLFLFLLDAYATIVYPTTAAEDLQVAGSKTVLSNYHVFPLGYHVMNDILILVLKTQESNPNPQETPYTNQDREEPARLPAAKSGSLMSVFKTLKLNLSSLKADQAPQDGPVPTDLLSHGIELLNYPTARRLNKEDSLNSCQIAAKPMPLKTHTYAGDVACLKKIVKRPTNSPTNKYQLSPVSSPERILQLASSGDIANSSAKQSIATSVPQSQPNQDPPNQCF